MAAVLHEHLEGFAKDLTTALKALSESSFAPDSTKTLRTFTPAEASHYIGITDGALRKAIFDGRVTDVGTFSGAHRRYTAEDIHRIRAELSTGAHNNDVYLPGRRDYDADELQVMAFVNFKGGSGKTSAAIHCAQELALRGLRVLAIDCDPQASLTTFFGFQPELDFFEEGSLYDAIRYRDRVTGTQPRPLSEIIKKTYFPNLDLVPGGIQVAEFEHETPAALGRAEQPAFFNRIQAALQTVQQDYDLVILDCPPQLGYVTLAAIRAAQNLIMTIIPERVDLASAAQFLNMASSLTEVLHQSAGDGQFENFKFLLSRFDTNVSTQVEFAEYIRDLFGDAVLKAPFLKSSAISEAGVGQQTVLEVDLSNMRNKRTYDRAIGSVRDISDELFDMLQANWGRK